MVKFNAIFLNTAINNVKKIYYYGYRLINAQERAAVSRETAIGYLSITRAKVVDFLSHYFIKL